jgi:hypothetical protein
MANVNEKLNRPGSDDINQDLDRQSETSKDLREDPRVHDPDRLKKENQKEGVGSPSDLAEEII